MSQKRHKKIRETARLGYSLLTDQQRKMFTYKEYLREVKKEMGGLK